MRPRTVAGTLIVAALSAALIGCSALGPAAGGADLGQPGPYAVGLTVLPFSRSLPNGQTRTVEVYFRFPVKKQGNGATATPDIVYSAAPAIEGRPFPLIVFSHGYTASPNLYNNLLNHLASHGFVVAAPFHNDCTVSCGPPSVDVNAENRPLDVSMVLDNLASLNVSDDSDFKGLVDLGRVGVAGQSFGGWTTLIVLERDPRFRAGLAINPATMLRPLPDPHQVARPVMLMAGVLDGVVPYALTPSFFDAIAPSAPDHLLMTVQQAGHQFMDACQESFVTTSCAASMPQPQLVALENRIGAAFLLRYVAGREVTDAQLGLHDDTDQYAVVKAPSDAPAPLPTARPLQATRAPDAAAGTILLEDSLTSVDNGKLPARGSDPTRYSAGYVDGAYQITTEHASPQSSVQGEAIVPGDYADASISVDAQMVAPGPSQYVQLACRSQSPTAQYRFAFRPATSEYWITRWIDKSIFNPRALLVLPGLTSPAVHQGGSTNHVELSCRGTTITGRINGVTVASVSDNTFTSGQMWLAAGETPGGPASAARASARFSNLVVRQE